MSDSAGLALLLESHAVTGVAFGGALGLLLWLLSLVRLRGALAAGLSIAVALAATGWPAAWLLAAVIVVACLARWFAARRGTAGGVARFGARDVVAVAAAATAALVIAVFADARGTWLAAAAAALAAGAACETLLATARLARDGALRLSWFPDPAGHPEGLAARAPVLAAGAAALVVSGGLWADLLGPGAPAPAALGALLALGLLALGTGTWMRLCVAAVGGLLGTVLAGFLA